MHNQRCKQTKYKKRTQYVLVERDNIHLYIHPNGQESQTLTISPAQEELTYKVNYIQLIETKSKQLSLICYHQAKHQIKIQYSNSFFWRSNLLPQYDGKKNSRETGKTKVNQKGTRIWTIAGLASAKPTIVSRWW